MATYPADLLARAAGIRLACFDVDGTLTNGDLTYDSDGRESKTFNVQDGLGLRLLEDSGIAVALITARESDAVKARGRDLRLSHVYTAVHDKADCLLKICAELGLSPDQAAHMGDDLHDLPALVRVGLAVAPANAHPWVATRVHWQTPSRGGAGAARELCDLILEARGLRAAVLARFDAT
ncbi:MAG: HAD hydrolase family protein [Arenimonas sp.]|nr:HAD hydrolase family protein [Arenimonas sp.]